MRDKDVSALLTQFKTALDSINTSTATRKWATVTLLTPTPGVGGQPATPVDVRQASVVIAPANPNRMGFVIFNNSANSGYVSLAGVSVASTCTRLIATFTSWEFFPDGMCYTGPISAIRNSGSGVMAVWEFTK